MSNLSFVAGALAGIIVFLSSCQAVRRVTGVESRGASDPLTRRFVGGSVEKWESGKSHAMGQQHTTAGKLFGGTGQNKQFGGDLGVKEFGAAGRKFSGGKAYKTGNYGSITPWHGADKASGVARKRFLSGKDSVPEGKRKWFGRNRKVNQESAGESGKWLQRKMWRGAGDVPEGKRKVEVKIVNPSGSSGAPGELSIDEIRGILGR
jgi:hypothetical protein